MAIRTPQRLAAMNLKNTGVPLAPPVRRGVDTDRIGKMIKAEKDAEKTSAGVPSEVQAPPPRPTHRIDSRGVVLGPGGQAGTGSMIPALPATMVYTCLLYTSDAADE